VFDVETVGGWSSDVDDYWITFCSEIGETISLGSTYLVSAVGQPSGLSDFGQWIFWGYNTANEYGNVVPDRTGIDPPGTPPLNTIDTDPEGGQIQAGLWRELGYTWAQINAQISGAQAAYQTPIYGTSEGTADDGGWQEDWYDDTAWQNKANSPVSIATLTQSGTGRQNQWVYVGGDLGVIPEPATLAIWSLLGLSIGGLAAVRRRRGAFGRSGWSQENRQAILDMIERGRQS
jgi:hypothetical protein